MNTTTLLTIRGALVQAGIGREVSAETLMRVTGLDFPALRDAVEATSRPGFRIHPTTTGWLYR